MWLLRIHAFALFLGIVGLAMFVPVLMAMIESDWRAARSFFYGALFTVFAAMTLATLLSGRQRMPAIQVELGTLVAAWIVIPAFAAIPLALLTPRIGFLGAWFEMVLSFTTTGSTVYLDPASVEPAIHLWRGIMAWLGGLLTLTAAYVIMAPRRLAGFEVSSSSAAVDTELGGRLVTLGAATPSFDQRLKRAMRIILPIYAGMTAALVALFGLLGQGGLTGLVHAMSIVSTSGVTPLAGGFGSESTFLIELVAAVFLIGSATKLLFRNATQIGSIDRWWRDPELRLMAVFVGLATAVLFLRHWFGALTVEVSEDPAEPASAIWGGIFTTLSFLTTTGFESAAWQSAREWSGLPNPGLILLALCAVGGGAATTAGGVKLIRAYALLRHGLRELDRIAQPHAIVGVGVGMRGVLREGAFIAWAFIMLFVLSILLVMLGLTVTGLNFESGFVIAIAALTNTGPVVTSVLGDEAGFSLLDASQRVILAGAMTLGRIETLGVIALFNPEVWRSLTGRRHKRDIGHDVKNTGNPAAKPPDSIR